jgi:hypothetical protein
LEPRFDGLQKLVLDSGVVCLLRRISGANQKNASILKPGCSAIECNRKTFETTKNQPLLPSQSFGRHRKAQPRHPSQQRADGNLSFYARQGCAKTVMDSVTKRQMSIRLPGQVKKGSTLELFLVAIRRSEHAKINPPFGIMTPRISISSRA